MSPRQIRGSEEHTSELQHLGISYAVFCLKKKTYTTQHIGRASVLLPLCYTAHKSSPSLPDALPSCSLHVLYPDSLLRLLICFFFLNDPATTEIYPLSLHDALPICHGIAAARRRRRGGSHARTPRPDRSEEHTSELQSLRHLVCRLLLEKKKNK